MGLFSGIAGIFGAAQEKRAAEEAQRILIEARAEGRARSTALDAEFSPFVDMAKGTLGDSAGLIRKYLAQTEGMDVASGLSESDKIAYEDAAKLLNEQMVSTGNLRSGAAAFGQSTLLRRVVADANERNFGRRVAKLQLLFGGANQLTSVGQTQGQIGLYGKQLSTDILKASMGLSTAQAGMEIAKGNALSKMAGSIGSVADTVASSAAAAFGGAPGELGSIGSYSNAIDVGAKYGTGGG